MEQKTVHGAAMIQELGDNVIPFPREMHVKFMQEMIHVFGIEAAVLFWVGSGQGLLAYVLERKHAVAVVRNVQEKIREGQSGPICEDPRARARPPADEASRARGVGDASSSRRRAAPPQGRGPDTNAPSAFRRGLCPSSSRRRRRPQRLHGAPAGSGTTAGRSLIVGRAGRSPTTAGSFGSIRCVAIAVKSSCRA